VSAAESALAVPGATLHVVTIGEGARPLVVLHGGPGEAHDCLRPWLDRLASPARSVVYFDQRGGKRSPIADGGAPVGWEGHVRDVEAVRAHLENVGKLAISIDLLGFSWGALLALLYASEHRDRVARLVLVSPPPTSRLHDEAMRDNEQRASSRPEVQSLFARLDAIDPADAEALRRARFAKRAAPYFSDPTRALDLAPVDTREDVAQAVVRSLFAIDLSPRFDALRGLAALVVHGADDPIPVAAATETADRLSARRLELAHAGHAPFVEAADDFVREVSAFLDGAA
jgi:proline iminopeptidase